MATRLDQSEFIKTALRLPPALHAAVHASAEEAGRSYNAELIALLEAGLNPTGDDTAVKAMAVAVAKAEEEAAIWRIQAEGGLFQSATICRVFLDTLLAIDALGVELPNKDEVDQAYADAYRVILEADASLDDGGLDDAIALAEAAELKLKQARADLAAVTSKRGPRNDPLAAYREILRRSPPLQPDPRRYPQSKGPAHSSKARKKKS
ncbi:Arc family DNA-binding protein [Variovorax sp. LT2P21]|uniref:Arc family DNA-binding protein n=1 Tax=Variovorax sp. LT2P21 TaxID=3443731 RepID=UPI003F44A560